MDCRWPRPSQTADAGYLRRRQRRHHRRVHSDELANVLAPQTRIPLSQPRLRRPACGSDFSGFALSIIRSEYCAEPIADASSSIAVHCRSQSGTGGRRRTTPCSKEVVTPKVSAVCRRVGGTAIGPELKRAQVVLYRVEIRNVPRIRLLRLPEP
jgi:hypothetical protein